MSRLGREGEGATLAGKTLKDRFPGSNFHQDSRMPY